MKRNTRWSRHPQWLTARAPGVWAPGVWAPHASGATHLAAGGKAVLLAAALLLVSGPAFAATLRPFRTVQSAQVRLSDLFADLGATHDIVLGPGPAPGDHIIVEAPQLAAIARDFGVDWRPVSGAERVTIERAGQRLPTETVLAALRPALRAAGAPSDIEITIVGFEPPMVPAGPLPQASIDAVSFDAASGHFTGELILRMAGDDPIRVPLAGAATATIEAAVLTRSLAVGATLGPGDVQPRRVPYTFLHDRPALTTAAAIGQTLRRPRAPGQPLVEGDLAPPVLVARGNLVRLTLEAGGIALAAQAVALDPGGQGERIRVENPSSHAIVQAIVTGAGEARVLPVVPLHVAEAQ